MRVEKHGKLGAGGRTDSVDEEDSEREETKWRHIVREKERLQNCVGNIF